MSRTVTGQGEEFPADTLATDLSQGTRQLLRHFEFLEGADVLWELNGVGLIGKALPEEQTALAVVAAFSPPALQPYRTANLRVLSLSVCQEEEIPRLLSGLRPLTQRLAELRGGGWAFLFPETKIQFHRTSLYLAWLLNPLNEQKVLQFPVLRFHSRSIARQLRALRSLIQELQTLSECPQVVGEESSQQARQERLARLAEGERELTQRALLAGLLSAYPERSVERCVDEAVEAARLLQDRPSLSAQRALQLASNSESSSSQQLG